MNIQPSKTPLDAVTAPPVANPAPVLGQGAAAAPVADAHSSKELRRALDALARRLDTGRTQLTFRVDQERQQVVISIVDPESGAVLRQIPAEEVMRMAQKLQEWLGSLVDETA